MATSPTVHTTLTPDGSHPASTSHSVHSVHSADERNTYSDSAHPVQRRSDFMAALTGLVVGGSILFALVFGIVTLTNRLYAGETHAEAAR